MLYMPAHTSIPLRHPLFILGITFAHCTMQTIRCGQFIPPACTHKDLRPLARPLVNQEVDGDVLAAVVLPVHKAQQGLVVHVQLQVAPAEDGGARESHCVRAATRPQVLAGPAVEAALVQPHDAVRLRAVRVQQLLHHIGLDLEIVVNQEDGGCPHQTSDVEMLVERLAAPLQQYGHACVGGHGGRCHVRVAPQHHHAVQPRAHGGVVREQRGVLGHALRGVALQSKLTHFKEEDKTMSSIKYNVERFSQHFHFLNKITKKLMIKDE